MRRFLGVTDPWLPPRITIGALDLALCSVLSNALTVVILCGLLITHPTTDGRLSYITDLIRLYNPILGIGLIFARAVAWVQHLALAHALQDNWALLFSSLTFMWFIPSVEDCKVTVWAHMAVVMADALFYATTLTLLRRASGMVVFPFPLTGFVLLGGTFGVCSAFDQNAVAAAAEHMLLWLFVFVDIDLVWRLSVQPANVVYSPDGGAGSYRGV